MGLIEWTVLGVLMLIAMAMSARIMRKGISTLDDNRKQCLDHIEAMDRQIAEDRKNMSSSEHLRIMVAAVEDLLRLDNFPAGWETRQNGNRVELLTPDGIWIIELLMYEKDLKSMPRMLHGKGRWHLSGPKTDEHHIDPAGLMRSLDAHIHEKNFSVDMPPHIARRMRHLPQEPH